MYDVLAQERAEPGIAGRFLGGRQRSRFFGTTDQSSFGSKRNAHTYPEALGSRTLFSLDECKACNQRFSIYEDALCKAVGPYLTLGGIEGKRGVRQTGRSAGSSYIKHSFVVRELRARHRGRRGGDRETSRPTSTVKGTVRAASSSSS